MLRPSRKRTSFRFDIVSGNGQIIPNEKKFDLKEEVDVAMEHVANGRFTSTRYTKEDKHGLYYLFILTYKTDVVWLSQHYRSRSARNRMEQRLLATTDYVIEPWNG